VSAEDIRDQVSGYVSRHAGSNDKHLVSWVQVVVVIGAYIASLGVFYGTSQAGLDELRRSVNALTGEVTDQTKALNRLANVYERLDEHTKSAEIEINRRLDRLEKDRTIETYKRN